jgi:hypothetical protein
MLRSVTTIARKEDELSGLRLEQRWEWRGEEKERGRV